MDKPENKSVETDTKKSAQPDNPPLEQSIEELESLINSKAAISTEAAANHAIPVLYDEIDPDNYDPQDVNEDDFFTLPETVVLPPADINALNAEQLDYLIGSVDKKLSGELDALVHILKDAIKDSVLTEIESRLKSGLPRPVNLKPRSDKKPG